MNPNNPNPPSSIDQISGGYRAAQVLFTANRLGVFSAVGEGSCSSSRLAQMLEANPRGMRILCDALASLGLLIKEDGVYRNSADALEYLLPGKAKSQTAMMLHAAKLYERWGKLYDVVKTGIPVSDGTIDPRLAGDEASFAQAMADVARLSARQVVELVDISKTRNMLDVGGGPGLYAIEFARANPSLRATVFDSESTLTVTRVNVEAAGLSDRVALQPGDALKDDIGSGYDFILVSNLIHSFSYDANRRLTQKCARALLPEGRLCIKDFFLDSDRTSPNWCALFSVNMLVGTEEGDCYTVEEAREWMENAGLVLDSVIAQPPQSTLAIGKKPLG